MIKFNCFCLLLLLCGITNSVCAQRVDSLQMHKSPAPLYRDPIYDGAADPVAVYNREKKEWWMFYTQRRANIQSANVAFCYGTDIRVATSADPRQTWVYKVATALEFEEG